jgi:hypothetical protein
MYLAGLPTPDVRAIGQEIVDGYFTAMDKPSLIENLVGKSVSVPTGTIAQSFGGQGALIIPSLSSARGIQHLLRRILANKLKPGMLVVRMESFETNAPLAMHFVDSTDEVAGVRLRPLARAAGEPFGGLIPNLFQVFTPTEEGVTLLT